MTEPTDGSSSEIEAAPELAVSTIIERVIADGIITFDEDGITKMRSDPLQTIEYTAICGGFGFSAGFLPPWHNTLSDDLENAWPTELYLAINLSESIGEHMFNRDGLERWLRYWYEIGYGMRDWGFPYSGGVTAVEFEALSPEEQAALMEPN